MDRKLATRLSKFLSLVLRHRPDDFGLRMDEEGFVPVEDIVDVIVAEDILAEDVEETLHELVEEAERPRFEIVEGRIRALYGHSSRIRLEYPEDEPPAELYHGTGIPTARRIVREGIKPAGRAYVHLSATEEEALSVGSRQTEQPVLIRIDTAHARREGVRFHQASEMIWLCGPVPAESCRVPELPEFPSQETKPERSGATDAGNTTPGNDGSFKPRTRKKRPRR